MVKDRSILTTEKRNPRSARIDSLSTLGIVRLINSEDARVAGAVAAQSRAIASAVDLVAGAFRGGGRLFYVGAGTSGRLGVLDAAECPPTFGTPAGMVQGIIAGGRRAIVRSVEGAEDCASDGANQIARRRITSRDVVVGIAACGLTPFVRGAIKQAGRQGARTIFITCSPEGLTGVDVDVVINPVVGPEVITGSTRMKAGTATKLVVNTITTAAMIRTGKVYGNLMVDLRATNAKLRDRAERIVMSAGGVDRRLARRLLIQAGGVAKVAILMHLAGLDAAQARRRLRLAGGVLTVALKIGKDK